MKLVEEFKGISGEICRGYQGRLTYFIRTVGCNLDCYWCDTKHSIEQKRGDFYESSVVDIAARIVDSGVLHVIITGGEPTLQISELYELISLLPFIDISIETNGTCRIEKKGLQNTSIIMDFKMPSSGMRNKMTLMENFLALGSDDFVKMVIATDEDLELAIKFLKGPWRFRRFTPVISPMIQLNNTGPEQFIDANYILEQLFKEKLHDVVISVQVHKFLGLR